MDHNEAVRLHAAEKYLLGELPKEQHAAYEEHYFDCSACAEEMKATAAFLENARQIVREEAPQAIDEKRLAPAAPASGGWFGWLRPAFAIPVFAALLFFIGYQNGVTIPSLKQASSRTATVEVVKSFSLMSVGSRGEGTSSLTLAVNPKEDFGLDVDMPGNSSSGYLCQIQDESGKVRFTLPVSPEEAKRSVHVNIPGGSLQPGKYSFVIFTGQISAARVDNGSAVAQLPFSIEFVR
ncbi:MAG: anti-sigma factor family protein [Candidatus Acidiferrales bacterium]